MSVQGLQATVHALTQQRLKIQEFSFWYFALLFMFMRDVLSS